MAIVLAFDRSTASGRTWPEKQIDNQGMNSAVHAGRRGLSDHQRSAAPSNRSRPRKFRSRLDGIALQFAAVGPIAKQLLPVLGIDSDHSQTAIRQGLREHGVFQREGARRTRPA